MASISPLPTLEDSLQARVHLLPEDTIDPPSSPVRSGNSTRTQSPDIPESQDADKDAHTNHNNNEAANPTSQVASSTVDDTDLLLALNFNNASPSTEDGDENNQDIQDGQANLQILDAPPPSEEALRSQAIAWMEATYSGVPNGEVVRPPPWYTYSRIEYPDRTRVWMKDFFTGHVRPHRLVNDRLASMPRAERERWANQQRRTRGEPAE